MNDSDKISLYRWLAIILGIVAVVLLVMWANARSDQNTLNNRFNGDLTAFRSQIIQRCTFTATSTAADRRECEDTLEGLSDLIRDYRNRIMGGVGTGTPATTTPRSTTTPTSTGGTATSSTTTR